MATQITAADQLAAIADRNRAAILRLLMNEPATLTQLAAVLGSYPARVRHHVKRLEDVGLIRLARSVTTRNYTEKFYQATAAAYTVHMMLLPERGGASPLVVVHCDPALEELVTVVEGKAGAGEYSTVTIGSLDGLIALKQGLADVAGCHLLDPDTHEYNIPFVKHLFPGQAMTVVTLGEREQGLLVSEGNPLGLRDIEDLAQPGVHLANRELGSGTRTWLDGRLKELGVSTSDLEGYDAVVQTHAAVAAAVAVGDADAGIAPRSVALAAGLDFVPLFSERYDLVARGDGADDPRLERLLDALTTRSAAAKVLSARPGYDTSRTGDTVSAA